MKRRDFLKTSAVCSIVPLLDSRQCTHPIWHLKVFEISKAKENPVAWPSEDDTCKPPHTKWLLVDVLTDLSKAGKRFGKNDYGRIFLTSIKSEIPSFFMALFSFRAKLPDNLAKTLGEMGRCECVTTKVKMGMECTTCGEIRDDWEENKELWIKGYEIDNNVYYPIEEK